LLRSPYLCRHYLLSLPCGGWRRPSFFRANSPTFICYFIISACSFSRLLCLRCRTTYRGDADLCSCQARRAARVSARVARMLRVVLRDRQFLTLSPFFYSALLHRTTGEDALYGWADGASLTRRWYLIAPFLCQQTLRCCWWGVWLFWWRVCRAALRCYGPYTLPAGGGVVALLLRPVLVALPALKNALLTLAHIFSSCARG